VMAKQVACGRAAGQLRMRQVWHHLEALPGEQQATDAVDVPMRSVDELCSRLDFRPDLVKVDVEGFELSVLAGARATLALYRPRLFLEIHPERLCELGGSAEEVVLMLAGLGYRFFDPGGAPVGGKEVARRGSVSRVVCATPP
jgi:Methyltransferase FkbM domain